MYTVICVYSPRVPQFFSCLFFLFRLRFLASWVTERLKTMWGRSLPGPPLWPRTGSIHSSPLFVSNRPAWGFDHTQSINQFAHTPSSSERLKMWYSFMSFFWGGGIFGQLDILKEKFVGVTYELSWGTFHIAYKTQIPVSSFILWVLTHIPGCW